MKIAWLSFWVFPWALSFLVQAYTKRFHSLFKWLASCPQLWPSLAQVTSAVQCLSEILSAKIYKAAARKSFRILFIPWRACSFRSAILSSSFLEISFWGVPLTIAEILEKLFTHSCFSRCIARHTPSPPFLFLAPFQVCSVFLHLEFRGSKRKGPIVPFTPCLFEILLEQPTVSVSTASLQAVHGVNVHPAYLSQRATGKPHVPPPVEHVWRLWTVEGHEISTNVNYWRYVTSLWGSQGKTYHFLLIKKTPSYYLKKRKILQPHCAFWYL